MRRPAGRPRRRVPAALALGGVAAACAGCNLDQRLLLSVTDVPETASTVELQIVRGSDGADSREPLRFTPTRSAERMGNAFTVGLYLPRGGERYTLGAAARDDKGCVLAAQLLPIAGDTSEGSLALQPFTPDVLNATLPRVCTPRGPALRDLQSSASTVDEYTLRGWAFGAATQVKLAALPDSTTREGYAGCTPSGDRCLLDEAGAPLDGQAPDVVLRQDLATLMLRGTHVSSASGAIGLCAMLYEGGALRTCAPVAANLLQFEQQTLDLGNDVHPGYLTVADFNQDGLPDLAIAGSLGADGDQGGAALVLLNQGQQGRRFAVQRAAPPADTSAPYPRLSGMVALRSAAGVTAADLDRDGYPELVVGESGQGRVVVLAGGPQGPRPDSARRDFAAGKKPEVSLAADLNGDLKPDILVVNDPLGPTAGQVTVLVNQLNLNPEQGPLSFFSSTYEVGLAPAFAAALPLTRGLGPDLLVTGVGLGAGVAGGVFLLRNQVAAPGQTQNLFPNVPKPMQPEFYPTDLFLGAVAAGDLNGDGQVDAVVAGAGQIDDSKKLNTQVVVLRGSPPPASPEAFAAPQRFLSGTAPFSVAIGDLNGDKLPDLAVANAIDGRQGSVTVLLNQGQGQFPKGGLPRFPTGDDSGVVALADFDKDGKLDLAVVNQGRRSSNPLQATAGTITVLLNRTPRRQPVP